MFYSVDDENSKHSILKQIILYLKENPEQLKYSKDVNKKEVK